MATLTTNKNFLSPVGFQFKISSNLYPNLEYFAVAATLPGLSMSAVDQSYRGVNLAFTGDRLAFEDLTLRINVTEDLDNFQPFNWSPLLQTPLRDILKTYRRLQKRLLTINRTSSL